MPEKFENNPEEYPESESIRYSVERYEDMLRKADAYFFDVDSFVNIIDYYMEKNDTARALQVVKYAFSQHPYSVIFLLKQAQILSVTGYPKAALMVLEKAESLDPSESDIFMVRGSILSQQGKYEEAIENFNRAIEKVESLIESSIK